MGSINIFKPPSTFLQPAPLITLGISTILPMKEILEYLESNWEAESWRLYANHFAMLTPIKCLIAVNALLVVRLQALKPLRGFLIIFRNLR